MPSVRSGGNRRRLKSDINVVPYIDVMLVLLIIFMVTAPLITPGTINLPSVGQASEVPVKPLEVQVSADGSLGIRMRESGASVQNIGRNELVDQVRSRITPDTPVVIAADGKVPYQSVLQVMDQLRSAGITRLGLLVDQKGGSAQNPTSQNGGGQASGSPGRANGATAAPPSRTGAKR